MPILFCLTFFLLPTLWATPSLASYQFSDTLDLVLQEPFTGRVEAVFEVNGKSMPGSRAAYMVQTSVLSMPAPTSAMAVTGIRIKLVAWNYTLHQEHRLYGSGRGQVRNPVSVSSDEYGHIFLIDKAQDVILKFSPQMELLKLIGGFSWDHRASGKGDSYSLEEAGLDEPFDIVATSRLSYLISDSRNRRLVETDLEGNFLREISLRRGFDEPTSIQLSTRNEIFILDSRRDSIEVFSAMRQHLYPLGGFGKSPERLNKPQDFVLTSDEEIVVLDSGNQSLKKLASNGRYVMSIPLPKGAGRICQDGLGLLYLPGTGTVFTPDLQKYDSPLPANKSGKDDFDDCTFLPNMNLVTVDSKRAIVRILAPRFNTHELRLTKTADTW